MPVDVKTLACRAVWRVERNHVPLANNLISSKRLTLDDILASISGVQYFFSCVTIMRSNAKKSSSRTAEVQSPPSYPGVAYFICYRRNEICNENTIFAAFHNADMERTVSKVRTHSQASSLFQVLKDHSNETVDSLVAASNTYCYQRAMDDYDDAPSANPSHSFSSKPCRIVVVNEEEMLSTIINAFERLESDGLKADFITVLNTNTVMLPTDASEITKTIRDIDRTMEMWDHALYRGHIYARPNSATFTFLHMMSVESYLHHLLSNDSLRERVLKHFATLTKILGHKDCTVIRQLEFNNDLIEVAGGVVFKISARKFIPCPISAESIRKISPRSFLSYDSTTLPEAGYFEDAILNSFPDLNERVNFLNKFYQCFIPGRMPQKVRKLVVAGPRDSGKTSWAAVFHRLIPAHCIASITKERQFSAAMIDESTQLVIVDEWSATSMDSSLAKTILQGGWITTAVKHQQPRSFFNNCPFYITTNEVPDFGKDEQENVLRRVTVYETQSLPEVNIGADKWIFENAMDCLVWIAEEINQNLQLVDVDERWYENEQTAAISNHSVPVSFQHLAQVPYADLHQRIFDYVQRPFPLIHRSFTKEAEEATTRSRERNRELTPESPSSSDLPTPIPNGSPLLSSQVSDVEKTKLAVDDKNCDIQSNATVRNADSDASDDPYFLSPDSYQLNDDVYFRRVAGMIKTKFYGQELKGKPVLAFAARMENAHRKERDFFTKADPYIDVWYLIRGMVRPVFDVEKFVEKFPNLQNDLFELRKHVHCRVLYDSCPLTKIRNSLLQKRQASKQEPIQLNIKRTRKQRR